MFEQDCKVCSRVPHKRRAWGCDSDAEFPFAYSPCPRCDGIKGETKCGTCSDDPRGVALKRCPMKTITRDSTLAMEFFGWTEKGVLPFPEEGGPRDQPALIMEAIRVVSAEVSRIERARLEK